MSPRTLTRRADQAVPMTCAVALKSLSSTALRSLGSAKIRSIVS